jgi:hypothetical protein
MPEQPKTRRFPKWPLTFHPAAAVERWGPSANFTLKRDFLEARLGVRVARTVEGDPLFYGHPKALERMLVDLYRVLRKRNNMLNGKVVKPVKSRKPRSIIIEKG